QQMELHASTHFVVRDALVGIIGADVAALAVVLPPFSPGRGSNASKPIVDAYFDQIGIHQGMQVLGADGLDADAVAAFICKGGENKVSFGAAEVIGPDGSVIEREGLGGRNGLRARSVRHGNTIIAPD